MRKLVRTKRDSIEIILYKTLVEFLIKSCLPISNTRLGTNNSRRDNYSPPGYFI